VKQTLWLPVAAAALLLWAGPALADTGKKAPKDESSFGALKAPNAEEARKQAETWLKDVAKKTDAASLASFKTVWESDKGVLEKVSATLVLGSPEAAKLLAEARDTATPAPTEVPTLLKDVKVPAFLRSNLALAYGKALTSRKVYEEALEALRGVKPEEVVDPSSLLFHKAVCEHALMLKDQADTSIDRLLVDVTEAPERYRMVAALMHFDMVTWQDKDLGWIARKMDNIQRRLDLQRGGKHTQKIQKEVLVRLDEMIKELENKKKSQCNGGSCPNDGNCPGGDCPNDGPGNQPQSSRPQEDTKGGTAKGTGEVTTKKVKELAEVWGKLPERERAKALLELTRGMPAKDRAVIEAYFKELAKRSSK
jgi:hypothetical protein